MLDDSSVTSLHDGRALSANIVWIEQLPFLTTATLVQIRSREVARTPFAATHLGYLPSDDYVHLVFDHADSKALIRLWERLVGLGEKPQLFRRPAKCHTCMETYNRISNAAASRLPDAVMKNDDLWYSDLLNLPKAPSFEDNRHCLLIVDAYSSYRTSLFSPTKDGLVAQLGRYLLWHYTYTERHPKVFQMDGAGELKKPEIRALMDKRKITPRYSPPYDPRPNGQAETSVDMAVKYLRSVLHHSGHSYQCWTYAITYWTHIRNRIPLVSNNLSVADNIGENPFSTYFPAATNNVSKLAIFGAFATVHLTKPRMTDLHRHTKLDVNTASGVPESHPTGPVSKRNHCPRTDPEEGPRRPSEQPRRYLSAVSTRQPQNQTI